MDIAKLAKNRPGVSHEMSTPNRGRMLATTRGSIAGKHGADGTGNGPVGLNAANIYEQPGSFTPGSQAEVGLTDADEYCCDYEEE